MEKTDEWAARFREQLADTLGPETALEVLAGSCENSIENTLAWTPPVQEQAVSGLSTEGLDTGRVSLKRVLGTGGMGEVRLAEQHSLRRMVAAKGVRFDRQSPRATQRLLQEAWLTARVNHPHVVPVHGIMVGDDGEPRVLLKRIDGIEWIRLIADEATVRARFAVKELIRWNLQVLEQVSAVMEHAHRCEVLHRDLKPHNVMIGPAGEVYVMDWGLAACIQADPTGALPVASQEKRIVGTPAYMAPEVAQSQAATVRSDVFLLGATLYQILTGDPPFRGVDVLSTIVNAQMAEVVLPEEEYGGLTSLCRRAMAREPAERIASVKLFRAELRSAIENLRSEWLAQQALESLQVLERALDDGTLREAPLHQSYGACRFGFLQALEIWPENQVASQGLRRSVECMVQHELNQGFAASAARLLGDHPDPPQALLDKVARRRRIQEEREQAVAAIERTRDPRIGYSVRLVFALMIGLFWCVGPFLVHLFIPDPVAHLERSQVLFYTGGTLGLILILFYLRREVALATQINRSVVAGTLIVMSTQIILTLLSESLGIRMETLLLLHPLIWAVVALMGAALVEPATAPIGLGYLLVVIAGALSFGGFFAYIAFANLLLFVNVIVVWRRSVKHASSADR